MNTNASATTIAKTIAPYVSLSRIYRQLLRSRPPEGTANATPRPDTWVDLDRLGLDDAGNYYRKTFKFDGDFIDDAHRVYDRCKTGLFGIPQAIDVGIEGYLSQPDALKLYELAYFCSGDVLELGTHKGLSTSILLTGLVSAGRPGTLHTVDIDTGAVESAKVSISRIPGAGRVRFNVEPAGKFLSRATEAQTFGLIFVDHWHGYEATHEAAVACRTLLADGGFVLFHDFMDPGNRDPEHVYGVFQAVADVIMSSEDFTFYGNFGACGLFRKQDRRIRP